SLPRFEQERANDGSPPVPRKIGQSRLGNPAPWAPADPSEAPTEGATVRGAFASTRGFFRRTHSPASSPANPRTRNIVQVAARDRIHRQRAFAARRTAARRTRDLPRRDASPTRGPPPSGSVGIALREKQDRSQDRRERWFRPRAAQRIRLRRAPK